MREVEESLERLRPDDIDLYQSHFEDPSVPLEKTLGAYEQLIRQGKVRAIGASNYSAQRLGAALEASRRDNLSRYDTLQPLYNLCERQQFEGKLERVYRENRLGVIPCFSLASGFSSGKYRSAEDARNRARAGFVSKYFSERGFRILRALEEVAPSPDATPAQVALAWLLGPPTVTAPIVSATRLEQLEEVVGAVALQLEPEGLARLNQASA